jgi:hypothetical protein
MSKNIRKEELLFALQNFHMSQMQQLRSQENNTLAFGRNLHIYFSNYFGAIATYKWRTWIFIFLCKV